MAQMRKTLWKARDNGKGYVCTRNETSHGRNFSGETSFFEFELTNREDRFREIERWKERAFRSSRIFERYLSV